MEFEIVEDLDENEDLLDSMIRSSRIHRTSENALFTDLQDIQFELRKRRMALLGSSVSLPSIIQQDGVSDDEAIVIFSDYLADLTAHFWGKHNVVYGRFCRQFYILAIRAIINPELSTQCLDDLIHLASLLTHEPSSVFISVMKDLLPEDWHGLLFRFTDSMNTNELRNNLTASFEDAVLAAISVCLGVLEDPFSEEDDLSSEEEWEGGVICV